jgi:hypothetical protein
MYFQGRYFEKILTMVEAADEKMMIMVEPDNIDTCFQRLAVSYTPDRLAVKPRSSIGGWTRC